jgi:transposase
MTHKNNNKRPTTMSLPIVNPDAAGIDVGDMLLCVAVPADRDTVSIREFSAFTTDLYQIAQWLKDCHIRTVAMESTGIYWKNIFSVLVEQDFDVRLVNARHTRNVSGRKTDEKDAQWIQRLHSCGLLNSCFLPDHLTETLRTLVRQRRSLTRDSSRYILRMQKAMESMNIKLHAVISNITGKTGTAILEAIISGQRDPQSFLPLVHAGIKADSETILKSLQANWREEHLFLLDQSYQMYKFVQQQIQLCEGKIEQGLQHFMASVNGGVIEKATAKKTRIKNQPVFNTTEYLQKIYGVDVTQIYGISEIGALEILAETGTDLSKWPTEKHFVGWLNLCPNNKISGGKIISSHMLRKKPNPAAQAFRTAANSLYRAKNWLGDFFRRMKAKAGHKHAIVATSRKLAIIYYKMVRLKQDFNPLQNEVYIQKFQRTRIAKLEKLLLKLKTQVQS